MSARPQRFVTRDRGGHEDGPLLRVLIGTILACAVFMGVLVAAVVASR